MILNRTPPLQPLVLTLILLGMAPAIQANHTPDPTAATIAGSLQDERVGPDLSRLDRGGDPGDAQPDDDDIGRDVVGLDIGGLPRAGHGER